MGSFTNFPAKRGCRAVTINTHGNVMLWFSKRDLSELGGEKVWLRLKIIIQWFRNLPKNEEITGKPLRYLIFITSAKAKGFVFLQFDNHTTPFFSVTHIAIYILAYVYAPIYNIYLICPFLIFLIFKFFNVLKKKKTTEKTCLFLLVRLDLQWMVTEFSQLCQLLCS